MQDLIREIVDMDHKAQQITDAALAEKVNSEKEIMELRERIRSDYLERARKRIAMNEPIERATAEKAWQIREANNVKLAEHLENLYQKKADEWIKTIVDRVIEEA